MANEGAGVFSIPQCDSCSRPAILEQAYSGRVLCGEHMAKSVRKKIAKELRQQLKLPKNSETTIFVAISGGKDSAVLLESLVDLVGDRPDVTIIAGTVDEGIEGYRPPSLICAQELCDTLGVEFITVSYPELSFKEMDEVVERIPALVKEGKNAPRMPCSYCGVFRRQGINHLAQKVNADFIALGHNLDDMAQTVLMNMTNGDLERTLRLAPHTTTPVDGLAPRIVPLRWIPEQEVHLYALHKNLPIHHEECPHAKGALRWRHREMVATMEEDVPGTRHGLLRMADNIKVLRDQVIDLGGFEARPDPPTLCPNCGQITSGNQCKACDLRALMSD
ncbi:MAG: TIGR00269 family protein [Euryarchaeota archaeon]|nr:TIGR00269 family protein [Euryarchaeota archaeon]|tara:strand:+ start:78117 stop:79118 length:1002 start_codon:yes stop_codon:yes gene_type:complete